MQATIFYIDSDLKYSKKCLDYLIQDLYNVKFIDSTKNALFEYSYTKPCLIIFDEKLKDGRGLNFIKKLQSFGGDFKTILFTKNVSQAVFSEALSLKIDKFVQKKSSFHNLINAINELDLIKEENIIPKNNSSSLIYDLGENFIYEEHTYNILKNGNQIQLTMQESKLINQLINANGEYVSQDFLLSLISISGGTSIDI